MIDQRFMQSLADDMKDPMLGETEAPAQDVLLAAGPVTSDVNMPFVGTRLNVPRAGQPQPTTQDRERMAVGLLDSLAGALRGAAAQTLGLPGDIRSIIDMIAQEGAEKYLGQRSFATTEEILQDTSVRVPGTNINVPFPPVLGADVPRRAERQPTVETAQEVGTFLPAPGIPEAVVRGGRLVGRAVQATKNMPVGMSTQMVGEGVSELGFYSAAKQAVDSIQQPKGTGEQFLKQIEKTPGVKPEEIKWTGLDDFLKSKKTVTKAEVQEYLDKNRVEVKEVQLGGGYATIEKELNKQGYELNVDMDGDWSIFKNNEYVELNELPADLQKFVMENSPGKTETKFSKYTLPGGENYREILLTLPTKMLDRNSPEMIEAATQAYGANSLSRLSDAQWELVSNRVQSSPQFKSQHFDQPNILAHMRVNDRVDADGKRVLFVEEVQSDWHQAGRKGGYAGDIQKQLSDIKKQREFLFDEKIRYEKLAEPYTSQGKDAPPDIVEGWTKAANGLQELDRQQNKLGKGVPEAPFKTTWHELALKRAIQVAAEGGYDRIAFTTGKTQAERYDLSKQISRVTYTEAGVLRAYDKSGEMVLSKKLDSPDQIEDYIGKEPAKKLLEKEVSKIEVVPKNVFDGRELSGVDLQVGGEGMKGFYDQILPKFLDKYAKKWDAKVGMTDIQAGDKMEQVKYVDITPKMKESVLTKGQPLFAIGAGGAAVQQEENE